MTSSALIRPARVEDLDSLYAMERAEFASGAYPRFFFRQALDAMGQGFLVVEVNQILVGYVLGSMQAGSVDAWVLSLMIQPGYRRYGLGKQLMQALLQQFILQEAGTVRLHVSPANQEALALYDRLGFREQSYEEHYFGRGEGRWVLEMDL